MHRILRTRKPNQRKGAMAENDDEDGISLIEALHYLPNGNLKKSAKGRRTKRVCVGDRCANSQGSTLETPSNNNPSSSEQTVHKHPNLSKLNPPSRSDGFSTTPSSLLILNWTSGCLISYIKKADTAADDMINLSSDAFTTFDALQIDYTPLYQAVYSVISLQYDKEALVKQKPHTDFEIKAAHDQMALEFSKEEERYTDNIRVLKEAQDDIDGLTDKIKRLYGELKKVKGKKAEAEAKAAAARAEKISSAEAYDKAKQKLEEIVPEMVKAQKSINGFEAQWNETVNGLDGAMEELSRLQPSLSS